MKIIISDPDEEIDPITEDIGNQITDNSISWEVTNLLPIISIDSHPSFPPKI